MNILKKIVSGLILSTQIATFSLADTTLAKPTSKQNKSAKIWSYVGAAGFSISSAANAWCALHTHYSTSSAYGMSREDAERKASTVVFYASVSYMSLQMAKLCLQKDRETTKQE